MRKTNAFSFATIAGTVLTTPPNYDYRIDTFVVSNGGTVYDSLTLWSSGIGTINGNTPGSVLLGKHAIPSGVGPEVIEGWSNMVIPAGSALLGFSAQGNITLTYSGGYQYDRDQ